MCRQLLGLLRLSLVPQRFRQPNAAGVAPAGGCGAASLSSACRIEVQGTAVEAAVCCAAMI